LQPLASSRAVRESLRQILASSELRGASLMKSVEDAGCRHGVEPFGVCLTLFSGVTRREPDARITFEEIEAHRDAMRVSLQRDPGFAVAAADYLQLVEGLGWHRGEAPSGRGAIGRGGERSFDQMLDGELRRHARHARPLSLLLLAPWSPLEPESVAAAATTVAGAVRDVDQPGRVLPEGVVVLLPCTEGSDGAAAGRRLVGVAERASRVPWCGGVAALPESAPDLERFGALVRDALEQARQDGPGRIRLSRRERRRHPRRIASGAVRGRIRWGAGVIAVEIVDLSLRGALIEAGAPVPVGDAIVLEVAERTPRGRSAEVRARILRTEVSTERSRPIWRVAVAFETAGPALPAVTHILAGLAVDRMPEALR
jgi:hypothetical protein